MHHKANQTAAIGIDERVARAVYAVIGPPGLEWDEIRDDTRQLWIRIGHSITTELGLTEEHATDKPGHRGINPQRRYVTP